MRLGGLLHDLRHAARALRRSPGFTLTAVATLAVGIGVNAAVFSVTSGVLLKGFPLVEQNDRLVYIAHRGCCVAYADFEDWRAAATSFERMAITHGLGVTFALQNGFPDSYTATEVSADTFRLVGQSPMLGRDFVPSDELPGAPPVVILRHSFWESRLGADPSIVGQTVRLNGVPTTVVGVMPPGFSFPQNQDFWVPLVPTPEVRLRENRNTWFVVARLADGVSIETARVEMETIGSRLAQEYSRTNAGLVPEVSTFRAFFIGANATLLYTVLWGAVSLVLLIACANLANLLLARAVGRSREMLVRSALGAGRARIVRQLLCESLLLSCAGGLVGWGFAAASVRLYSLVVTGTGVSDQILGDWFDQVLDYSVDARVLVYLAAVSIGTGLLFGLAPARRLALLDVNAALKEGGRGVATTGRGRLVSTWLIAGEMALAVVLLAGAGVLTRSFLNLYTADLGIRTDGLVSAIINLPQHRYPDAPARRTFHERLEAGLGPVPGVEAVTVASAPPAWRLAPRRFEVSGAPPVDDARHPAAAAVVIGSSYFHTLGAAMIAGREFRDTDGESSLVAIVNQRFATTQWPGQDPIGRRVRLFGGTTPDEWRTVVGIAPHVAQDRTVELGLEPLIYLSIRQMPQASAWIIARTSLPAATLAPAFRRVVQALDPDLPLSQGPVPLGERVGVYQFRGVMVALLLAFAGIAVLLAALGLYAVVAYSVNQRMEEIGTRIAVGATGRDILALVLRQGLMPVGVGLVIGLAVSAAMNGLLQSQLVRVSASDPITLCVTTAVLVLAATLGCWIPARRAARIDPIIALRHQ